MQERRHRWSEMGVFSYSIILIQNEFMYMIEGVFRNHYTNVINQTYLLIN